MAYLEDILGMQKLRDERKMALLRLTKAGSSDWKWRTGTTANKGNITRLTAQRRAEREQAIADAKARIQEGRKGAVEEAQN